MVPTLKSLHDLQKGLAVAVYNAATGIANNGKAIQALALDMQVIRRALLGEGTLRLGPLPSPSSLAPPSSGAASTPPPSQPRPSMAVKAGKTTATLAPWVVVLLGLLSEIAARHTAHGGAFSAIIELIKSVATQ